MAKKSFRKIFLPAIKVVTKEIKEIGFKRVSTAGVVLIDALRPMLADGDLLDAQERQDLARVGRAVLGDTTAKLTTQEADKIARMFLEGGLGMSGTAAGQVIVAIMQAKKEGIDSGEIGAAADEDDAEDDIEAALS